MRVQAHQNRLISVCVCVVVVMVVWFGCVCMRVIMRLCVM